MSYKGLQLFMYLYLNVICMQVKGVEIFCIPSFSVRKKLGYTKIILHTLSMLDSEFLYNLCFQSNMLHTFCILDKITFIVS